MPKRKRVTSTGGARKTNTRNSRKQSKQKNNLFTTLTNRRRPLIAAVLLVVFAAFGGIMMVKAQAATSGNAANGLTGSETSARADGSVGPDAAAKAAGADGKQDGAKPDAKAAAAKDDAKNKKQDKAKAPASSPAPVAPPVTPAPPAAPAPLPLPLPSGVHDNIITTIFWAGELPDASNAYISNVPSAWDEYWADHYGGYDDPDNRNGYYPAAFTPKENPFYVALPYNDLDANGNRKPTAGNCPNTSSPISWCKNAWVKVTKGGKTAYAQWQDVGPLQEDDVNYVFGTARPANTWGAKAGLDVSPAVRDYLGLAGVDTTSWSFVPASSVPAGPWKNIVTTNLGGW